MWSLSDNFNAADVDARVTVPRFTSPFNAAQYSAERTRMVVDSRNYDVGHVTDDYTLVRNPELRNAVELIADRHGIAFEPYRSQYRRGKTCLVWKDSKRPLTIDGDTSPVYPFAKFTNDYTGSASITGTLGILREICKNALLWGVKFQVDVKQPHKGTINLLELLEAPIMALSDQVAVAELQMNTLSHTELPFSHPVYKELKEATPKRYHDPLGRAIRENAYTLGHTAYAALQAAAEIGTHRMRGWAGIRWTENASGLIIAAAQDVGAVID